jgi:dihydroorotase
MKLIISNALLFDQASKYHATTHDVKIDDGVIVQIGKGLQDAKTIDLGGSLLTPSLFDLFANFNEPGLEHREDINSGIRTAAFAGFTDVCIVPNTSPVVEKKSDINFLKGKSNSGVTIHPLAAVSEGCLGENLTEILDLNDAGAVAFSDGLNPIWNGELLLKALQYLQKFDGLLVVRPKDIHLSQFAHMHEGIMSTSLGLKGEPSISEEISLKRDIDILRYAGGRIHFTHISTAEGVNLIKAAKKEGLKVTCDVALNQLIYTEDDLIDYDTNYKVDPPYRGERDRKALIKGLREDVIDAIVTSHQPLDIESKELEFDLAMPGMCSMPTVFASLQYISNELPLEISLQKFSNGPRAILGKDQVHIEVGSKAKFAIFDPNLVWKFDRKANPSKSNNSPLLNTELKGYCLGIFDGISYHRNKSIL